MVGEIMKLIYKNERGGVIEFANHAPLMALKLDLNELKNNIQLSKNYNQDGSIYHSSQLEHRQITLEGAILREFELYKNKILKIVNPKQKGTLIYNNEKKIGVVVDSIVISRKGGPVQKFLITFICPNPYWQELQELKQYIALWKGDFTFPLQLAEQGIMLGHREPSLIVNVFNNGDVPCGMRIEFKALGELTNPSLFNVNTREYIKINKTMQAGETIIITTHFANKRVELIKSYGTKENAFNYIDLGSTFMQLDVGDNLFRYDADINVDNLEVLIYYTPQYLGV